MTITEYVKRLDQERHGHQVAIEEINANLSVARRILSNHYRLENSPERHFIGDWYRMWQLEDPVYGRLQEITHRNAASLLRDPAYNSKVDGLMTAMLNRTMTEEVYTQILEGTHPDAPKRNLYERLNKRFIDLQKRLGDL
ncbi:hypothetical protein HYX04_01730 [Candidatus Woesearchaeota archaeon]|nr:hypothetical protein [Candidatus Woesearchaeota archaeon]